MTKKKARKAGSKKSAKAATKKKSAEANAPEVQSVEPQLPQDTAPEVQPVEPQLPRETAELITRAEEISDELLAHDKKGRGFWVEIGRAFQALQNTAMRAAQTNKPYGKKYQREHDKLLAQFPKLSPYTKSERADAIKMVEHWPEIQSWLDGLSEDERRRLNHPTAILRRWKKPDDPNKEKRPSFVTTLKDEIKELDERLHDAEQRAAYAEKRIAAADLDPIGDSGPITSGIDTMATKIYERCGRSSARIRQLIEALRRLADNVSPE